MNIVNTIGNAIENIAEAIGDTIDDVVEVVTETVQEAADGAAEIAQDLGILGVFVRMAAVVVSGILQAIGELIHNLTEVVNLIGGTIGAVLRLDGGAALDHVISFLLHLLDTVLIVVRFVTLGYFFGALQKHHEKHVLRAYVKELIEEEFSSQPDLRDRILQKLGLVPFHLFRFAINAEHRVMRIDTRQVDQGPLPLWQAHDNEDIDLYEMAGLPSSYDWNRQFNRPDTAVVEVDENGNDAFWPVTRERIDDYLSSQGETVRLRLYAMTRRTAADRMDVARRKLKKIGLYLNWNDPLTLAAFRPNSIVDIDIEETTWVVEDNEIRYVHAYEFNFAHSNNFLTNHELKTGNINERCHPLSCAAFTFYEGDYLGMTLKPMGDTASRHWVIYHRDTWPHYLLRYVLAHELGHYFGIQHADGINNIMFSNKENTWFPNIAHFWLNSGPTFSLDQGKRAWDFIIANMRNCLTA